MTLVTIKQFFKHLKIKWLNFLKLFCSHKHCVYDVIEMDLGGKEISDSLISELFSTESKIVENQKYIAKRLRCIDCGKILSIKGLDN